MTNPTRALAAFFLVATAACAAASEMAQPSDIVSSSSTSVSSTSIPFEISYSFRIGIYPSAPIRSLQMKLIWAGGWTSGFYCSLPAIGTTPASTATSTVDEIDLAFDFGDAGLQQ